MEFPGCPQGVQLSPGGAVVSTAPTNLKAPATLLVQLRQLHPLTAPLKTKPLV